MKKVISLAILMPSLVYAQSDSEALEERQVALMCTITNALGAQRVPEGILRDVLTAKARAWVEVARSIGLTESDFQNGLQALQIAINEGTVPWSDVIDIAESCPDLQG